MADLVTTRNVAQADDLYQALIDAHDGLTKAESDAFNARLILVLFNHIGDANVIEQALRLARG